AGGGLGRSIPPAAGYRYDARLAEMRERVVDAKGVVPRYRHDSPTDRFHMFSFNGHDQSSGRRRSSFLRMKFQYGETRLVLPFDGVRNEAYAHALGDESGNSRYGGACRNHHFGGEEARDIIIISQNSRNIV